MAVIAGFENEPVNANAYLDRFPDIQGVFLETIHSESKIEPYDSIAKVPDFTGN